MGKTGYLVLENGEIFEGISFGAEKEVFGEVVFNTGMTGYPESFTDPSYYGQILTLTYPLIGNYGVPPQTKKEGIPDCLESEKIQIRGLIVSSYIESKHHWQAKETLSSWLKKENVPALYNIDTRSLTQVLREFGVMKGKILFDNPQKQFGVFSDINRENLVSYVSCKNPIIYGGGKWRVLILDCGLKYNQIRLLLRLNTTLIRIPWDYNPFIGDKKLEFDCLFISNGPGDPKMVPETIAIVKEALKRKIPVLGICLGNQILALAAGANTYKLKYGHRGQNQPVIESKTKRCFITSQNHGFAVDSQTLPSGWVPWFTNLNDKTNEGVKHTRLPFFSVQFHPESNPGPTDTAWLFDFFLSEVKKYYSRTVF